MLALFLPVLYRFSSPESRANTMWPSHPSSERVTVNSTLGICCFVRS